MPPTKRSDCRARVACCKARTRLPLDGGIGLGFEQTAGHHWKVTEIVPGSSTDQSGIIRIGDTLLSVNGNPIHALTVSDVIELIKSQPGSSFPGKTANPDDVQ